jgi:acyl-CoA dehydrogenase
MVGGVSGSAPDRPVDPAVDPVTAYGLTAAHAEYAAWVRLAAVTLEGIEPVHGAVNRPLVEALGRAGLLRGLFGGAPEESPRDAAAMQLCLLREMLATINTEAETALALQGLGAYPILQSGTPSPLNAGSPVSRAASESRPSPSPSPARVP